MPDPMIMLPGPWRGMTGMGNLDLLSRPDVANPDGGTSSVYSMSVGIDGKEYLIPRVSEDARLLSEEEAVDIFRKTGNHLGMFDSPENANAYARMLHEHQASLGEKRKAGNRDPLLETLIGN